MDNANTNLRAATKLEIGKQIRKYKTVSRSTLEIMFREEMKEIMMIVGTYSWQRDARVTAMSMILDGRAAALGLI